MILAILQARCSSSRLPGKVLLPLLGRPMLARQIERLKNSQQIDRLVLATSSDPSDDPIPALCRELNTACFRGSLNDVLDRFYTAARQYQPEYVVRLTGDCPLTDPQLIDEVIRFTRDNGFDYASNCDPPTFPDGLDVEVFRFKCLEEAWQEAILPSHREHVTVFIREGRSRFRVGNYRSDKDLSALRWTVDEPMDFAFVEQVYNELYPQDPMFKTADILRLLARRPELSKLNGEFERNEGLLKSLAADKEFLGHR